MGIARLIDLFAKANFKVPEDRTAADYMVYPPERPRGDSQAARMKTLFDNRMVHKKLTLIAKRTNAVD